MPGGVYQAGAKRWVGVKGSNGWAEAGSGDFCESRGRWDASERCGAEVVSKHF